MKVNYRRQVFLGDPPAHLFFQPEQPIDQLTLSMLFDLHEQSVLEMGRDESGQFLHLSLRVNKDFTEDQQDAPAREGLL